MLESQITPASGSSFLDINGNFNPQVPTPEINPNNAYMIDWSKLKSVNDLILILQMLGIAFPGNHPGIPQIKEFLDFQNSVPLNDVKNPQSK
jgi:hypothetical protein